MKHPITEQTPGGQSCTQGWKRSTMQGEGDCLRYTPSTKQTRVTVNETLSTVAALQAS